FLIGDNAIVRLERVSLSIKREKFLAVARKPHIDAAFQFVGVKGMRRLAKLQHHEIRDVDDVVDRANADALNFRAQPLWAGTDFHTFHSTQREKRTFARCRDSHARFLNLDLRLRRRCLELLSAQRRDFTSETEMAEQIAAVWRDLDVENRVRQEKMTDRRTDFCI